MKHVLLKFIVTLFIASLAFVLMPGLAVKQGWIASEPTYSSEIIFTLGLITIILFHRLHKIQKTNPQGFVQFYLFSIAVKMVVGCVLILVIIFMDREGAIANALLFILGYFLFTILEIIFLMRRSKNKQ
jgi:hypothetical protein